MSHFVTISDPTFGSFIRVTVPPGTEQDQFPFNLCLGGRPCIWIGPLARIRWRIEHLDNVGSRVRNRDFLEKPCNHSWLEGSITGDLPETGNTYTVPTNLWIQPGNYTNTWELTVPPQGYIRYAKVTYTVAWVEERFYVHCTVSIKQELHVATHWPDHEPIGISTEEFTASFRMVKTTDPYSGAVTFSDLHVYDDGGLSPPRLNIELGSGPFGAGPNLIAEALKYARKDLFQNLPDASSSFQHGEHVARDASIYAALDDLQILDVNPLTDLGDLLRPLEAAMQLYKAVKGMTSLIGIIKGLAGLHLMWKYVVKTNILTAKSISSFVDAMRDPSKIRAHIKKGFLIGHGRQNQHFTWSVDRSTVIMHTAKVCYGVPSLGIDSLLDLLNMLGLTPRWVDLWDAVPYSFVVDWVIPLGDAINNMELNNVQQRLPFIYMVIGRKEVNTYKGSFWIGSRRFDYELRTCAYSRTVLDEFPSDVWFGVGLKDPRRQLLTGGALITQALIKH